MLDKMEDVLEIRIRHDGTVVWVNGEHGCLLRVCRIKELILVDEREMTVLPDERSAESRLASVMPSRKENE